MANAESTPPTSLFHTYRKPSPSDPDLLQGDLLAKTEGIKDLIRPIHPYYLKVDYTHFIVLTQSCDLVRRSGSSCRARYITIAAVRPLELVIQRELEKHQDGFAKAGGLCSTKFRNTLVQFLERLLNNNEPEFFFLQSEPTLGLSDPHCAFLRLSIPIKADSHYDACVRARLLSLTEGFQAKLGWLVGNIYSRVGTEDWVPGVETEHDFQRRISLMLDRACKWVDDKRLMKAKETSPAGLLSEGQDAIREHIEAVDVPNPKEEVVGEVIKELRKLNKISSEEDADRIANRLRNNHTISKYTKLPS